MERLLITTAIAALMAGGVAVQANAQNDTSQSSSGSASLAATLEGVDFSSIDENGDGQISAEEWTASSTQEASGSGPLAGTFTSVDTDANGNISQEEFEEAKKQAEVNVEGTAAAGGAGEASKSMTAEDREARQRATEGASRMGLRDVQILERVFVVQGVTPQDEVVYMLINPPGATLVGIGRPLPASAEGGNATQQDGSGGAGSASDGSGSAGSGSPSTGN